MNREAHRHAWLVLKTGLSAGTRYPIRGPIARVGRHPENDVVIEGPEASIVSSRHCEIQIDGDTFVISDTKSTNGTYVDGTRVEQSPLEPGCSIRLGPAGPELEFRVEVPASQGLDQTIALPLELPASLTKSEGRNVSAMDTHDRLLSQAVEKARAVRKAGLRGQTITIMREMVGHAVRRSGKKLKTIIGVLTAALVTVTAVGLWRIHSLKTEKSTLDRRILEIETMISQGSRSPAELDRLIETLNNYQRQGQALRNSLLYNVSVHEQAESFVEKEIKVLLAEFGAEQYSVPPEFAKQVNRFIQQYQGPDRPNIGRALGRARKDLEVIRTTFQKQNLPPDLAYMVLVESAFIAQQQSPAGAAGLWQFTPDTARAYGLQVNGSMDERFDPAKSTLAATRYIRELILDFGAGSSVMLALAAYNLGPAKVKRAVRKVEDPIKQRNFWYLYRTRALPTETREYVPKLIAAIIIGRNTQRLGF